MPVKIYFLRRKQVRFDGNKNTGNTGLSLAIAYFGANGYTVSVPLNDTQDYDLVVDMDGVLKKVQVKATNNKASGDAYVIPLRTFSGTSRKCIKTVKDTDIDLLFCLCGDGSMFLLPAEAVVNSSSLTLAKERSKHATNGTPDYSKYLVNL